LIRGKRNSFHQQAGIKRKGEDDELLEKQTFPGPGAAGVEARNK